MNTALHIPAAVQDLVDAGALFAVNNSGGKDSQAMLALLRQVIPAAQLMVVHAHLAGEEWDGVEDHVREMSAGLDVVIAEPVKTFVEMVERRGMFPSPQQRQCTSDLKRGPIDREIRRYLAAHPEFKGQVVSCQGMRAQESTSRSKLETFKPSTRNSVAGRAWFDWLPIHDLTADQVFATIAAAGQKPHWAYAAGMSRLSCMFCIMASQADLRTAARLNPEAYRARVLLERQIAHTMNMEGRALDDVTGISIDPETDPDGDLVIGADVAAELELELVAIEAVEVELELAAIGIRYDADSAGVDLQAWLGKVHQLEATLRPATPVYQRFDRHARQLTVEAIRASDDREALQILEAALRCARYPGSFRRLDRVWNRAELGELIVESTNRGRQLAGQVRRPKGPALDPRRIPADRLEALIQQHRDLATVDALRAERERRSAAPIRYL